MQMCFTSLRGCEICYLYRIKLTAWNKFTRKVWNVTNKTDIHFIELLLSYFM